MPLPSIHQHTARFSLRWPQTFLRCSRAALFVAAIFAINLTTLQAQALPGTSSSTVTTPHVTAELQAWAPQGFDAGATVWAGLSIQHQPGWHTYWKNAGDSGLPTQLQWTLPAGISAGDIAWPLPRKFPLGSLANYGYDKTVLLPVPLTISPDFKPSPFGQVDLKLKANWLVCRVECIPEEGEFSLRLPASGSTALNAPAFEQALASQPQPLSPEAQQVARIDASQAPGVLDITISGLPEQARGKTLGFFAETPEVIETGADWQQEWQGDQWHARIPLSAYRTVSPDAMPVVITLETEANAAQGQQTHLQGWRVELPVQGPWPAVTEPAPSATPSPALTPSLSTPPSPTTSTQDVPLTTYLLALAGAFLGGLLLNFMPCVFPVLAIKALGLMQQSKLSARQGGVAYTLGVIVSFLALAGLLLALRAGGEAVGWGFQLQSPWVVAGLATLFTLLGLNLAGLFQIGQVLPAGLAGRQLRHPALNSAFSGVLAVAVASPCTAPFMGASLGFTLTLPTGQTLLLFAVLGLGLASPFLLLSFAPGAARLLPKPGAWMETLRQFMAFPMFGTVAWLLWVLGQQSGTDGVAALVALLVALALLLWALGRPGRTSRWVWTAASVIALATLTAAIGPAVVREMPVGATGPSLASSASGWQAWTPEREQELLSAGRPVLVDYTAAWCITCQYNKRTTLSDASLLAHLTERNVALLRADWTRRDAMITQSLAKLGRNGVPTYVLLLPGTAPKLLPEILSTSAIMEALENQNPTPVAQAAGSDL